MHTVRYFSLFSGIGGFELGLEQAYGHHRGDKKAFSTKPNISRFGSRSMFAHDAGRKSGATCVGYSEINLYAKTIYERHFLEHQDFGDISKIDEKRLPDFELLLGGFPCQPFSISGRRRGFSDTRGTLFFELCRIVREKRPPVLLLENVKGLLSHDQGRTFGTIINTLDELGYDLQWQVLNSADFGVPQNRERVFIIGHIRGKPRKAIFPIRRQRATGFQHIERSHSENVQPCIRRLTPVECERLQGFPDEWTKGASDRQRYKCLGNSVTTYVVADICSKLLS